MLSDHRLSMQLVNENYYPHLKNVYLNNGDAFPKDIAYATGIFDVDKNPIDSYMQDNSVDFDQVISLSKGYIHFVLQIEKNNKGAKYLVYETKDDALWHSGAVQEIMGYGLIILSVLIIVGIYLMRLFLRPMKDSIELLDNFIKDTTHELNTPVSVIVANIESIDKTKLGDKEATKIKRMDIAARTISNIYNDLTYLVLHHNIALEDERINLSCFIQERLEYFKMAMEQKKLHLDRTLADEVYLEIDSNRLGRLIDNILSNAIKYNRVGGSINVVLTDYSLKVSDTGIGIPKEKLSRIFERYQRANDTVGGFGIGLHIVAMIAHEYGIEITVDSKVDKGTQIELKW